MVASVLGTVLTRLEAGLACFEGELAGLRECFGRPVAVPVAVEVALCVCETLVGDAGVVLAASDEPPPQPPRPSVSALSSAAVRRRSLTRRGERPALRLRSSAT
jgi:hypothetical protein